MLGGGGGGGVGEIPPLSFLCSYPSAYKPSQRAPISLTLPPSFTSPLVSSTYNPLVLHLTSLLSLSDTLLSPVQLTFVTYSIYLPISPLIHLNLSDFVLPPTTKCNLSISSKMLPNS